MRAASHWDDAADKLGRLWQGMKTDVGGTLGNLWPNMVETFGNGQSFDTFQGFATHSKLMCLGPATAILAERPDL